MRHRPGVGATLDFMRVSVATLARVVFKHPGTDEWMLALERKATLVENQVEVKSQPFGGAVRILNLDALHELIGDFHFDSERSRAERDLRLYIRPSGWPALREFCIQHLSRDNDAMLETNPARELAEEFAEALKINLHPGQYAAKPLATLVENEATPTGNVHARGIPTARVYRIFEATITDPLVADALMKNSEAVSHEQLCELALDDARRGGRGRANAVLALSLKGITDTYLARSLAERNSPIYFEKIRIDETVPAVLEGITVPKYQRL